MTSVTLKAGLVFAALFAGAPLLAQSTDTDASTDTAAVVDSDADKAPMSAEDKATLVAQNVKKHLGDFEVSSIEESPIPGLFELVSGGTILYVNEAGTILIEGDMIDLEKRVSMTDQKLGMLHVEMISSIAEDDMLVYQPAEPTGRSITVFTDITCGYCQRLHKEMET